MEKLILTVNARDVKENGYNYEILFNHQVFCLSKRDCEVLYFPTKRNCHTRKIEHPEADIFIIEDRKAKSSVRRERAFIPTAHYIIN